MTSNKNTTISTLKAWAAPALFSALCFVLWAKLDKLETNVDKLLSSESANNIEIREIKKDITSLEARTQTLESQVYKKTASFENNFQDGTSVNNLYSKTLVALKEDEIKIKHETE